MSHTEKALELAAQILKVEFVLQNTIEKLAVLKKSFDGSVPLNAVSRGLNSSPALEFSSGRSPLETLDSLARRITLLMSSNAQISDDLKPISDELIGLREDMAHVFHEVKAGSLAASAASAASAIRDDKVNLDLETARVRLNNLEEQNPHTKP